MFADELNVDLKKTNFGKLWPQVVGINHVPKHVDRGVFVPPRLGVGRALLVYDVLEHVRERAVPKIVAEASNLHGKDCMQLVVNLWLVRVDR